jgi:hypothetical protein
VLLIALAVTAGTLITIAMHWEPGLVLGISLLAGTIPASFGVRHTAAYLMLPVPATTYVIAATVAGLVHDRELDTSRSALALNFVQWIAGGFFAMVSATGLIAAIALYRWLRNKTGVAVSGATSDRQHPPPTGRR